MSEQLRSGRERARWQLFTFATIGAVVLIVYHPALSLGFYSDDWIFYDLAGRLPLSDYLIKYFDPRVQTTWYRPIQGILFRIEFIIFGSDPLGYHLSNILFHLANCFLLFALVRQHAYRWQMGLIAALLFASLPTATLAVLWSGVVDALETLFFLTTVWFWLSFLKNEKPRDLWITFGTFILALLTKEIAIILPIILFLVEICWSQKRTNWRQRLRRYAWFVAAWLAYLPIEYIVTQRSIFITREDYQIGIGAGWNLLYYLSVLVFPWSFVPWLSYAALLTALIWFIQVLVLKKAYPLVPLLAGAILILLPVTPFPVVTNRFLYLPLVTCVTLYAGLFMKFWLGSLRRWRYQVIALAALTLIMTDASRRVANNTTDFGKQQRESYATLQNITQKHPTLPEDTFFYFVDPPVPGPTLSGMLLWHYGTNIASGANDSDQMPRLRDHRGAFVVYFDDFGKPSEVSVEKENALVVSPTVPSNFSGLIELEEYAVTGTQPKAGEVLVLLLHWRAKQQFKDTYRVNVELVSAPGDIVARQNHLPREWRDMASRRRAGESIIDAHIFTIPSDAAAGIYRLQVSLYDPATLAPLTIVDNAAAPIGNKVVIEPFVIAE